MSSAAVVAPDIHKKFSRAVVMDPGGKIPDDRKISHADRAEM